MKIELKRTSYPQMVPMNKMPIGSIGLIADGEPNAGHLVYAMTSTPLHLVVALSTTDCWWEWDTDHGERGPDIKVYLLAETPKMVLEV